MSDEQKKYIDRGDYVLEISMVNGREHYRRIPKIDPAQAQKGVDAGRLKIAKNIQPQRPGPIRRAANYGKAAVQHAMAGSPKSSRATIEQRFAICQKCPSGLYQVLDAEKIPASLKTLDEVGTCAHASCGCFLHATDIEPAKLAWADQVCPAGHWGKAVSVDV